jgi:NAD(P)-dependent dehydrogenase (short-subunit alcohol dehydrogenase family)
MSQTPSKLIFITGVSSGFGRAIAEAAVAAGHRVVGTLRSEADLAEFNRLSPGHAFGRILDVTDTAAIAPAVAAIESEIGPVDVLINNAGYGHEGVLEESALDDIRRQFEVNVFGAVAMMQAVLPSMRKRRSGHIINITSMGGLTTFPGVSVYHGSKFALEGISESLGKEIQSFGIHVTAVEPGAFRTDWAGRSMVPGDPVKAAHAILQIIAAEKPPVHLLLGTDAVKFVSEKLDALQAEIAEWKALSLSTDFT